MACCRPRPGLWRKTGELICSIRRRHGIRSAAVVVAALAGVCFPATSQPPTPFGSLVSAYTQTNSSCVPVCLHSHACLCRVVVVVVVVLVLVEVVCVTDYSRLTNPQTRASLKKKKTNPEQTHREYSHRRGDNEEPRHLLM